MNIFANHFWGAGNLILIYNTGVSLIQGFLSFLLVAEMPFYFKTGKTIRAFSFSLAAVYNAVYLYIASEFFLNVWDASKPLRRYDFLELLIDIFFAFHLAFYAPVFIFNTIILGKEIVFEFSQKNRTIYYGGTREELKLNVAEMYDGLLYGLNFFNPLWWLKRIFADAKDEDARLDDFLASLTDEERAKYLPQGK